MQHLRVAFKCKSVIPTSDSSLIGAPPHWSPVVTSSVVQCMGPRPIDANAIVAEKQLHALKTRLTRKASENSGVFVSPDPQNSVVSTLIQNQ